MTSALTYDGFVSTTADELWDRLHQAQRRFAALLSVTPSQTPVPGSDWNAGQVAAHVLTVLRRYTERDLTSTVGLSRDGAGVAVQNAAELAALEATTTPEVLDQIWQQLAAVEEKLPRTMDLNQQFPFHGGQTMDGAAALGNLIGEFLVHGRDVATAGGRKWKIGGRNAALALTIAVQTAPAYVAPDAPGDLKLAIRTPETTPWVLDLSDGELTSRPARRREPVDVRVLARPEPLLLNLYGRIGIPQATLLGTAVVGGRRPWRVSRLGASFLTP